jgi:hypothetical protein
MEARVRAWVWNFDAELELERGAKYQPTHITLARNATLLESQARPRMGPEDVVLPEPPPRGAVGMTWCPTPRALAQLAKAKIAPAFPPPSAAAITRVNERGFAFQLAEGELAGCHRVTSEAEAWSVLDSVSPTGQWLCKRAFGFAGRGQRAIAPGHATLNDRAFVRASVCDHALYIEPRLSVVDEFSVHAWAGARTFVGSIRQTKVSAQGVFQTSTRAVNVSADDERALIDQAERVGMALASAGYAGPFGIDALAYRDELGRRRLRTLSEINARFCMEWDQGDRWDPP